MVTVSVYFSTMYELSRVKLREWKRLEVHGSSLNKYFIDLTSYVTVIRLPVQRTGMGRKNKEAGKNDFGYEDYV